MKEFIFHNCYCTKVIDGDTIDVEIDIGFNFMTKQRLRLYGINAPEKKDPLYLAATNFVIDSCLFSPIQVITYEKDSFGRWLSIVYKNGENLNDLLIEKGLAVKYIP